MLKQLLLIKKLKYCSDIVYLFIKYAFNALPKLISSNHFSITIFSFLHVHVLLGTCITLNNNDYFESKIYVEEIQF